MTVYMYNTINAYLVLPTIYNRYGTVFEVFTSHQARNRKLGKYTFIQCTMMHFHRSALCLKTVTIHVKLKYSSNTIAIIK